MTATVLSFFRRSAAPCDWSTQELAEFYRVESALVQAGMHIDSDRGMTDEGEPWFVFCRVEDDEVVIHFARIGGKYVISAPAYCGNASGTISVPWYAAWSSAIRCCGCGPMRPRCMCTRPHC